MRNQNKIRLCEDPVGKGYVMAVTKNGQLLGFISSRAIPDWIISEISIGKTCYMQLEPGITFEDIDWERDQDE